MIVIFDEMWCFFGTWALFCIFFFVFFFFVFFFLYFFFLYFIFCFSGLFAG